MSAKPKKPTRPAKAASAGKRGKRIPAAKRRKRTFAGDAELPYVSSLRTSAELRSALYSYHEEVVAQAEQLKYTQAELEESQHRYAWLYDEAPVGYVTLDHNGIVERANLTATRFLGIPRDGILYRPLLVFIHEEDRPVYLNFLLACRRSGGKERQWAEVRLAHWRRKVIHVQLSSVGVRRDSGGRIVHLTAMTDVSGRARIEQERKQAQDQILEMMQERSAAEAANEAKDRFLAVVSHELRTPLSAILLWSKLLQDTPLTDTRQIREGLHAIQSSGEAQKELVEDLLDLSRITTGQLRLEMKDVELIPIVRDALTAITPAAQAKQIELTVELDPMVGVVRIDPDRLRQVVWNLLTNAVKFTPSGGHVLLAITRLGGEVEIRVSDTGRGIEESFLPHVFESFRQADSSHSRSYSGIGVGLTIVKQLVELHGGTIHAHSAGVDKGSTFLIRLPLPESALKLSNRGRPSRDFLENASEAVGGRRVLLVEDDPDTRRAVAQILRDAGLRVTEVESAHSALREFEQSRPDLLISDIGMPGMDGYALIQQVRRQESTARQLPVPAIAFTAFAHPRDCEQAFQAGYQQHLAKPVEPEQLLNAVVQALRAA
jgi:PAS domain S-box-containing protein